MRVLVVRPGPNFSVADVHRGWVGALRRLCGAGNVADLNLDDRLTFYEAAHVRRDGQWQKALAPQEAERLAAKGIEQACYEMWPDLVFIVSGFYTPAVLMDLMRRRGHTVALLCTESPYEDDRQVERAAHADITLLNDPINRSRFEDVCPVVEYAPHCYDPDVHHSRGRADVIDFTFVGTGYPSRIGFFEQVDWDGLDVTLAGNWPDLNGSPLASFTMHAPGECIDNRAAAGLYRATAVAANLYRREADRDGLEQGWAVGPREVELAACGTFFLRDPRGEGDELFPSLPTFLDADDFADQLRWWLDHDDLRRDAAVEAREAIADRTFDNNARRLLELTERVH